MDQNTNNIPVEQPANMGANNQNPVNNLSVGNAAKGCF